ncbi:MAG: DUF4065 domain-containing protein [Synergistaceae bacterium]|jgi:uncharacterized phage-associated protein|nr:DUF4065 domain-containing protein [Synergistaceae bacterium]
MTYSAKEVAEWILWLAAKNGIRLSPLQLQKHLYYAQGYSLGMIGEKLFNEPIYAWKHGPVVREVFYHYKRFGADKITPPAFVEIPQDVFGIIDVIISEKGKSTASELRNATHVEAPYSSTPRNDEITPQRITDFFVDQFWASDEEDEYEPSFDNEEDEHDFFREVLSPEKMKALKDVI